MTSLPSAGRLMLWLNTRARLQASPWRKAILHPVSRVPRRCIHNTGVRLAVEVEGDGSGSIPNSDFWKEYRGSFDVPPPTFPFENQVPLDLMNKNVTAVGFLKKIVRLSDALSFAQLTRGAGPEQVQILLRDPETTKILDSIRLNSAISVTGVLKSKYAPKKPSKVKAAHTEEAEEGCVFLDQVEISAESITCLNSFEKNIPYGPDHVYPLSSRHLQIRFDSKLRDTLFFRSQVAAYVREELSDFHEIETPILFKSTPEGAREFLVPTRKAGCAYALPQSPQQYKQMLMASGINRYLQFARCFRDEDLRADRQPEFTQVDLEMAWVDGEGVMQRIEKLIKSLYSKFSKSHSSLPPLPDGPFYRMTYDTAMSYHGSDKPDLRVPGLIHRVDHIVPPQLRSMTTYLQDPILEVWKIRLNGSPDTIQKFVRNFFSGPDGEHFQNNADGAPGISVFNSGKPLEGLQMFGFEAAEKLKEVYSNSPPQPFENQDTRDIATTLDDGDLIILQARQNLPHSGGSTALGKLRLAIYNAALSEGLIEPDPKHHYLWVTDFPMFMLEDGLDPGQGGVAGFSATHHPFTAPKTAADVDLLLTDPLKAKADHYDLVVNGVELGGGSRRIHSAEIQKFIMRDVLKMSQERIEDFSHLLKALSAGCPPHAGFAIGFDRLIAVMCDTNSVRDVIAFPKNSKGDDLMVSSPRRVTKEELGRYKLQVIPGEDAELDDSPAVGEVPQS